MQIKDNLGRTRRAIAGLWVAVGFECLCILVMAGYLSDIPMRVSQFTQEILNPEFLHRSWILIQVFILALVGVLFFPWFRRAYGNIRRAKDSFTDEWAVAGFFVPIANLGVPYRIMTDTLSKTIASAAAPWTPNQAKRIGAWWGLWLGFLILGNLSFTLTLYAMDILSWKIAYHLKIASSLLSIGSAYFLIRVLKVYRALEPQFRANRIRQEQELAQLMGKGDRE